jgi:glycine/D-amino acid oxidase-like deaminating enzyme
MLATACLAADFKSTPYWWEAAPPETTDPFDLPARSDVVIVGSGYCGLSAATELANAGRTVVVLDAGPLGIGASTRSGGMVTGGQKFVVSGALAGHPNEKQKRILEDAKASLDHIEQQISQNNLDANYRRCGRLIAAVTPWHYSRLETWTRLLDAHAPGTTQLVPRNKLTDEIGGRHYFGALLINNYGGLHPAKYHKALRGHARSRGAHLIGDTPVHKVERNGDGFVVRTARGDIHAGQVLVATNGYSDTAGTFLSERVVGAASYIIATEPLPVAVLRQLNPHGRMISDTKRSLSYFRLSPDLTRVVFGGRASGRDLSEEAAAPHLHRQMCEIWPELADFKVSHCWRGNVGMTSDHIPHMGTHDGVHYAVGCNGSGVAMMSYLGHQSALKMLGRQNRPCAFESDEFPKIPMTYAKSWLVPAVTRWYLARDWLDAKLADRQRR